MPRSPTAVICIGMSLSWQSTLRNYTNEMRGWYLRFRAVIRKQNCPPSENGKWTRSHPPPFTPNSPTAPPNCPCRISHTSPSPCQSHDTDPKSAHTTVQSSPAPPDPTGSGLPSPYSAADASRSARRKSC